MSETPTPASGASPGPRRRTFSAPAPTPRALRDVDQARRVRLFAILVWAGVPSLFLGALLGYLLARDAEGVGRVGLFLAGLLGLPAGALLVALGLTGGAGAAASLLHSPSGRSTPRRRDHSPADALVMRGDVAAGIAALEHAILEDPSDSAPYLRIARLYRDELGRHEDAVRWFRKAREARLSPSEEKLVARELIELFRGKLGQPERAAPELARFAERWAGTREGDAAREELAELKRLLAASREGLREG